MIFVLSSFIRLSEPISRGTGARAAHFEDAFARFLPQEPNIRTLKRGREGDVMFGCSDVYTFTKNRMEITSEQVVQELLADPNSPWHECRSRPNHHKRVRFLAGTATRAAAQFEDAFARFLRRATGQRNSRTRSRASCPRSRTSEHSSAGARDVMFGCSDVYHWMGGFITYFHPSNIYFR